MEGEEDGVKGVVGWAVCGRLGRERWDGRRRKRIERDTSNHPLASTFLRIRLILVCA